MIRNFDSLLNVLFGVSSYATMMQHIKVPSNYLLFILTVHRFKDLTCHGSDLFHWEGQKSILLKEVICAQSEQLKYYADVAVVIKPVQHTNKATKKKIGQINNPLCIKVEKIKYYTFLSWNQKLTISCHSQASLSAQALRLLTWLHHDSAQYF